MAQTVFVYGTLMPGHLRWGVLAPHARGHRPAVAVGTLYDTGNGWPAASFDPPGSSAGVCGWLVDLEPTAAEDLLERLDEIEGVVTDAAPDGDVDLTVRYRRRRITASDGTEAWAYAAAQVPGHWQQIERWVGGVEA